MWGCCQLSVRIPELGVVYDDPTLSRQLTAEFRKEMPKSFREHSFRASLIMLFSNQQPTNELQPLLLTVYPHWSLRYYILKSCEIHHDLVGQISMFSWHQQEEPWKFHEIQIKSEMKSAENHPKSSKIPTTKSKKHFNRHKNSESSTLFHCPGRVSDPGARGPGAMVPLNATPLSPGGVHPRNWIQWSFLDTGHLILLEKSREII